MPRQRPHSRYLRAVCIGAIMPILGRHQKASRRHRDGRPCETCRMLPPVLLWAGIGPPVLCGSPDELGAYRIRVG